VLETEITLKVVITVRDYPRNELSYYCRDVDTSYQHVEGLHKIPEIKSSHLTPSKFRDWKVRQRIVAIAMGIPALRSWRQRP
jgi:hypothetical protein